MKFLRSDSLNLYIKITGCVSILAYTISNPLYSLAADSADQSCNSVVSGSVPIGGGGYSIYQSFKPRFTYLSGVSVLLNTDGDGEIRLRVLSGNNELVSMTLLEQKTNGEKEYRFDFAPVKVISGQTYKFIIESAKPENEGASWYYVQNEKGDCYTDGNITTNREDPKVDMRFVTYGYDEQTQNSNPAAVQNPSESPDQKESTTQASVVSEAPDTPTAGQENNTQNETPVGEESLPEITKDSLYPPAVRGEVDRQKQNTKNNKIVIFFILFPLILVAGYRLVRKFIKK